MKSLRHARMERRVQQSKRNQWLNENIKLIALGLIFLIAWGLVGALELTNVPPAPLGY